MRARSIATTTTTAIATAILLSVAATSGAAPPVAVTACGTVITSPGSYVLANDLVNCPDTAVTIDASEVKLQLAGRSITGTGSGFGVRVLAGAVDVKVQGPGTISGFFVGLGLEGVDDSSVKSIHATNNVFGFGINASTGGDHSERNKFIGNAATGNSAHGFTVNGGSDNSFTENVANNNGAEESETRGFYLFNGTGNRLRSNTANDNGALGISVEDGSTGHDIRENTALGNDVDLVDGNPDCDDNVWLANTFATSFPASGCIQ